MNKIPLMDSQVIRALLVALVGLAGMVVVKLGYKFDDKFWADLVDAVLLVLTTGSTLWAAHARATKPTPPLTDQAVEKTAALEASQKQGGFARVGVLACLAVLGVALAGGGCTGTRDAYRAAGSVETAERLEATAYVVGEHYAAVVKEAAALKTSGALTGSALEAVRKADDAVRPLVLGSASTPGLQQLVASYKALRNAETEAALQAAIDDAVLKLSALINALKGR